MNHIQILVILLGSLHLQQATGGDTVPGTFPPVPRKYWSVTPKPDPAEPEQRTTIERRTVIREQSSRNPEEDREAADNAEWDLIHASGIVKGRSPRQPGATSHVVRQGETLWDLASRYFGDPWFWPELWSWNAHVTNPHWLFPGTVINLTSRPVEASPQTVAETEQPQDLFHGLKVDRNQVIVRNRAFIDAETLEKSRPISGSPEEKSMLSIGDQVYIRDADKKLKPGNTYAIFRPLRKINDPRDKKSLGQLVQILGEVKIEEHRPRGVLRATITRSLDTIRRKDLVGPVQTSYKQVAPVVVKTDKREIGRIVATIEEGTMLSANDMIILNLGKNHGIRPGAVLPVIVRGDGLHAHLEPLDPARKQDDSFPYEVKGTLVVYQVHERYSFALVLRSHVPLAIGDDVLFGEKPDTPEKDDTKPGNMK